MPKKQKPNPFFYFMLDWKEEQERKGRRFTHGLRDVQNDPGIQEAWKNITEEQKNYYKHKVTEFKETAKKRTGLGECIDDVQKEEDEQKAFIDNMKYYVSDLIKSAEKSNSVQDLKFHIVHVNYSYCRIRENMSEPEYYPAELAIAEFSLLSGVTRTYHKLIRSVIHTGYAAMATEHSGNTHQIPRDLGESDYQLIWTEICEFLMKGSVGGKLPPLYTVYSNELAKNPAESILGLLSLDFPEKSVKLYSLEELYLTLHNSILRKNPVADLYDYATASLKMKQDPFDYKRSIMCEYHQTVSEAGNHCSKSTVQRWAFVICVDCCPLYNIDFVAGQHVPVEDADEYVKTTEEWISKPFNRLRISAPRSVDSSNSSEASYNGFKHESERTFRDESRRKAEAMAKPLQIFNHSLTDGDSRCSSDSDRPLRAPFTKPASYGAPSINMDDFPAVGLGGRGGGRGRGARPKSRGEFFSTLRSVICVFD
ncbi:hypothetical protein QAD02_017126 [Eretmocerus hayati]|uniref:Uncharacterized protein n=1 Tax=Eretmocerus hayati TaxID=131215 RepID=A0ACC2PCI7_9HYME|nr:hypothetical protein QAD02_017126 [Eretmocerus hayati]